MFYKDHERMNKDVLRVFIYNNIIKLPLKSYPLIESSYMKS